MSGYAGFLVEVDAQRQRCGRRALALQVLPASAGEHLEVVLVGELGIGDGELALEILAAHGFEPLVGFRVDARDEEARDGQHLTGVAASRDEPLEPAQVGLSNLRVALQREDQRDVDRLAVGDAILDRRQARLGGGDLDVAVRTIDEAM